MARLEPQEESMRSISEVGSCGLGRRNLEPWCMRAGADRVAEWGIGALDLLELGLGSLSRVTRLQMQPTKAALLLLGLRPSTRGCWAAIWCPIFLFFSNNYFLNIFRYLVHGFFRMSSPESKCDEYPSPKYSLGGLLGKYDTCTYVKISFDDLFRDFLKEFKHAISSSVEAGMRMAWGSWGLCHKLFDSSSKSDHKWAKETLEFSGEWKVQLFSWVTCPNEVYWS